MARTLLYVAYPMRLDLTSANAIQTFNTVCELRRVVPGTRLVIPRWLLETSAFASLRALHLPRPAFNKLSRLLPWAGWSYIERTLYALLLVALLMMWRLAGRSYRVLYVRDTVCAAWLCLLAPLHGSKVVYEVHDLEAAHPSRSPRWPSGLWARFLPWLDRVALQKACRLVSLTDTFRDWACAEGLRAKTDIAVIPDAYDPDVYYPQDTYSARAALRLPAGAFIVAYAGLTFAYRGLDLLVRAFAHLAGGDKGAILALVGGRPSEVEELRALATKLGIAERVIMTGQIGQEQTALYLNAADALAIPDTVTGMTASPLKLFEYMAVGKPIVCKDIPALREVLDDSALFFPEDDVEALASALARLGADREEATQLGEAALQRASGYTYRARAIKIAQVVRQCR